MEYLELAKQILGANYWAVGVRSLCKDEEYKVGDICRDSYEWDVEEDCSTYYTTGETANGTCATRIDTAANTPEKLAEKIAKALKDNKGYGGTQVVIAGNKVNNDGMFDPDEIRIVDAKVIAVLG